VFLDILVERYGPLVRERMLLGIEFGDDHPMVWMCGERYVIVKLSENARLEPRRATYQLAHEAVHLLSPLPAGLAPVIEEGLAVAFEREMSKRYALDMHGDDAAYNAAGDLAEQMLADDSEVVKRIRCEEPTFERWTPQLLERHGVNPGLSRELCVPFEEFRKRFEQPAPTGRNAG
jgi:hypothetical protein